jgi:tetratricopeptide (TPR) repeat protein
MYRLRRYTVLALALTLSASSVHAASDAEVRALELCRQGKLKEAVPLLNLAIDKNPLKAELYYNRALAEQQLGHYKQAVQDYNKSLLLKPVDPLAFYNRGLAYASMNQYKRAIMDFGLALHARPEYTDARLNRGNAYLQSGEYEKAIDDFTKVIKAEPEDAQAFYGRANARKRLGYWQLAISDLDEAISRNPRFSRAYFLRSMLALTLDLGAQASQDALACISIKGWDSDAAPYCGIVAHLGYRISGQPEQANKVLADTMENVHSRSWPYPIIAYMSQQSSLETLLNQANSKNKATEARTYAGMERYLAGDRIGAISLFEWVTRNGNPSFDEYQLATSLLKRLQSEN